MKAITEAIIQVMKDVEGVAKSMTVGSGNNSYKGVSDKDVRIAMRESMITNGLSLLPISVAPSVKVDRWDEVDQYSKVEGATKSKQSIFTEVTTKYLLIHTSGESIEVAGYGQGIDTQDKGAGKATTYAMKNTLLNMFLVPTGVDTDDTHSDDLPTPPKKKTVDTPSGGKKEEYYQSHDEHCPKCGEANETKKGTTKTGKPYELADCGACAIRYFVNRKEKAGNELGDIY